MKFEDHGSQDQNNYLQLKKDKDQATGVFRGEPFVYRKHWLKDASGTRTVLCVPDACPHCAAGNKSSFGFKIAFITKENGAYAAKVWDQGWTVYNQLKDLNADYPLEKTIVKIKRSGTGQDTTYMILPESSGHVVKPETEAAIALIALPDLNPAPQPVHHANSGDGEMKMSDPHWQNQSPPPVMHDADLPF
jgi:hypothetical protein